MITSRSPNRQNHYTLQHPIRKTKNQAMGVITNYALILLWMHQNGKGKGFTKKQLIANALGHVNKKYVVWGNHYTWTDSAYCCEFSSFNANELLSYNKHLRLWYEGPRLQEYINYHFGPYVFSTEEESIIGEIDKKFDFAKKYNEYAIQKNKEKYDEYLLIKEVGKEYFFQD